ncbi:MAG TPA: hypothetical protein VFW19_08485 [Allosphingosinicella sp.]|nr:hypothetical protein [Allosphingosinicella sp.]
MRNPIGIVILAGGLSLPAIAPANPPQPSAEEALNVEQDNLRSALHPSCAASDGEILVCGRLPSDRDRLPLPDRGSHALPGEPASAMAAMKAIGPPRFQPVGLKPKAGNKPPMFDVGALVFSIVLRFINRDRDPPPIPHDLAAN